MPQLVGACPLTSPAVPRSWNPRPSTSASLPRSRQWVAAGRRAAYVSDGNFVDNVHFAAGIELCRTVGCVVTHLRGRQLEGGRGLIAAADADTHYEIATLVAPPLEAIRK